MQPQVSPYIVSLTVGQALAGAGLQARLTTLRDKLAQELAVPWPEPMLLVDAQLGPRAFVVQGGQRSTEGQVSPEDPLGDLVLDEVERFWLANARMLLDPQTTSRLFPSDGAAVETHAVLSELLHDGVPLVAGPLTKALREVVRPGMDPRVAACRVRERITEVQIEALMREASLLHVLSPGELWEAQLEGHLRQQDRELVLEPALHERLLRSVGDALALPWPDDRRIRAVMTSDRLRRPLRDLLVTWWPRLAVLTRSEIPMAVELLSTTLGNTGMAAEPTATPDGLEGHFAFLEHEDPELIEGILLGLRPNEAAGLLGLLSPGFADLVLQLLAPELQEQLISLLQSQPPLPVSRQIALACELQLQLRAQIGPIATGAGDLAAARVRMQVYTPVLTLLEHALAHLNGVPVDPQAMPGPLSAGAIAAWLADHTEAADGVRAIVAAYLADQAELSRLEAGGEAGVHRRVDLFTALPPLVDWCDDFLELSLEVVNVCDAAGQWDLVNAEPTEPDLGIAPFVIELGEALYVRREQLLDHTGILGPGIPLADPEVAYRPGLTPHGYRIMVRGREVSTGMSLLGFVFKAGPGLGFPGNHPLTGARGVWMPMQAWQDHEPEDALDGVEAARLFALHLQAIALERAPELVTLEAIGNFLESAEARWPKTVEAARMAGMDDLTCFQVVRGLLRAGTPVADHLSLLEALALALFEAPELTPVERAPWLVACVRASLESAPF